MNSYIRAAIKDEGANLLFINGVEDHVHLLVAMPAVLTVPSLLEKVKPTSTKWMRKTFPHLNKFSWQDGYGGFTVSKSILPKVIKYIENQEEHHKKISYKQEFLLLQSNKGFPTTLIMFLIEKERNQIPGSF